MVVLVTHIDTTHMVTSLACIATGLAKHILLQLLSAHLLQGRTLSLTRLLTLLMVVQVVLSQTAAMVVGLGLA